MCKKNSTGKWGKKVRMGIIMSMAAATVWGISGVGCQTPTALAAGKEVQTFSYSDEITENKISYKINTDSNTCKILTVGTDVAGNIIIPDYITYENTQYAVTGIATEAFESCEKITGIQLPESITQIGDFAFSGCSGLTEINLPAGITTIGEYAFKSCSSLKSLNFPKGIQTIETGVCQGCKKLDKITIPKEVKTIENKAFAYCNGLQSVLIPEGVTKIAFNAFNQCSNLKKLILPMSFKNFMEDEDDYDTNTALEGTASNLIVYAYDWDKDYLDDTDIKLASHVKVSSLYKYTDKQGVNYYFDSDSVCTVDGFTKNCKSSITIPSHITQCDGKVFKIEKIDYVGKGSTRVKKIKFSEGIKKVDLKNLQEECVNLKEISIPKSVTKIEFGDNNLKVTIASGNRNYCVKNKCVYNKKKTVLYRATGIGTSVKILSSTKKIDGYAFKDCKKLKKVTLPKSLTKIGSGAFQDCKKLKKITIPNKVTEIGSHAFWGCTSLEKITLSKNLKRISTAMLAQCVNLKEITIPNKVTVIETDAFHTCKKLQKVKFSNKLKILGEYAFSGCIKLKSLTFPKSFRTFDGMSTFNNCVSLKKITFLGKVEENIYNEVFWGANENLVVYVQPSQYKTLKKRFKGTGVTIRKA